MHFTEILMIKRVTNFRFLTSTLFFAFLVLDTSISNAALDLSGNIYNVNISTEQTNKIESLLPEYGGLNPEFISNSIDPNIHLLADAEISITFIDEGAGFQNSFGYYAYDNDNMILYEQTVFSNASKFGSSGSLFPGDTVSLGTHPINSNIGFWLIANGYKESNGHKYYSQDHLNSDGLRHMAIIYDSERQQLILGFEDTYYLGDKDYNDVIFTSTVHPFSALDISTLDISKIPVSPVPSPSGFILFGTALMVIGLITKTNPHKKPNRGVV